MTFFKKRDGDVRADVRMAFIFTYKNLVFNEYDLSEKVALDPSSAENIYDKKEDMLIPVPK